MKEVINLLNPYYGFSFVPFSYNMIEIKVFSKEDKREYVIQVIPIDYEEYQMFHVVKHCLYLLQEQESINRGIKK